MAFKLCHEDPEMDGEVHFIGIHDRFLEKILCYPKNSCGNIFSERVIKLREMGFKYIVETGVKIGDMRILGKGYSAIVVMACHEKYGLGALKVRRIDSRRDTLLREALIMSKASDLSIVPRLYLYDEDLVFREFISTYKCIHYPVYLRVLLAKNMTHELKTLLNKTMDELFSLDKLGIDHTELNRLEKHMYHCIDGEIKIIDWESARESSKPVNLSSFISYLLYRFNERDLLIRTLGIDIESVLQALREYKRTYSVKAYGKILSAMRVQ